MFMSNDCTSDPNNSWYSNQGRQAEFNLRLQWVNSGNHQHQWNASTTLSIRVLILSPGSTQRDQASTVSETLL